MAVTYAQYAQRLTRQIEKLEKGLALEVAVRDTIPVIAKRIFIDGLDSNGGKIGQYSTKPIYVSDKAAPKQVNHKGKTGKTIKSGYYGGGYKQFRSDMGREAGFVNLRLNNELQSDFLNAAVSKGSDSLANFPGTEAFKVDNHTYQIDLKKSVNAKKRKDLESRYGKIFDPTKQEIEKCEKVYDFELEKILTT